MNTRFLFLVYILVSACTSTSESPLTSISRDILDLFIKEELSEKEENPRICLYLKTVRASDNSRELLITYGYTSLFHEKFFNYKGYNLVLDGDSDGFFWNGVFGANNFKTEDDIPYWLISQYNDNTINRFLTTKSRPGVEDIADLLKVFDSYGLLKDDSDWAKQHCFPCIYVDTCPVFPDDSLLKSFIKKEFKPINSSSYSRIPAFAEFHVSKKGELSFVDVYVNDISDKENYILLKSECSRVAKMICQNFKMIPAIHRGVNVDVVYRLPFYSSVCFDTNYSSSL